MDQPDNSAPQYEGDFSRYKSQCDVIMHAHAYAQQDDKDNSTTVGLEVGKVKKFFQVTGPRHWEKFLMGTILSKPQPFVKQVISYDVAYGGTDDTKAHKNKFYGFPTNPTGRGYFPKKPAADIDGISGPHTQELDVSIETAGAKYKPQSFGPIGRNWTPRTSFVGTYDQEWIDNVRPFLPDDFDEQYYQCTPPEQQTPHLKGGELVTLYGVTPYGRCQFRIPKQPLHMGALDEDLQEILLTPVIDTLIIEPELQRFSLVWRANIPLKNSIHELDSLTVGTPSRAWLRAKMLGKQYISLKPAKKAG